MFDTKSTSVTARKEVIPREVLLFQLLPKSGVIKLIIQSYNVLFVEGYLTIISHIRGSIVSSIVCYPATELQTDELLRNECPSCIAITSKDMKSVLPKDAPLAYTTDLWKSPTRNHYIWLTVHVFNRSLHPVSLPLTFRRMTGRK